MRTRWTPQARAHLLAAHDFAAADRPRAAAGLIAAIVGSAGLVARHPGLGGKGRFPGTRELLVAGTPFIIVYRSDEKQVEVLAIPHASRRLPGLEP